MEVIRSRRSPKDRRSRPGPRRSLAGAVAVCGFAPVLFAPALPGTPPLAAQEPGCPDIGRGPPAGVVAPDSSERSNAYRSWANGLQRADMGTGYLDVEDPATAGPPGSHDWLPRITLPLWARPSDDEVAAWIHRGRWLPIGFPDDRIALTYRGMVETEYEAARMIVTEAREDGWLQVWVDVGPVDIRGAATWGLMWTHRCRLDLGDIAFEYVPWSERFLGPGAPPLSFRDDSRHALRETAGVEAPLITWLEPHDEVELLEIEGDWARVRATRPGVYLAGCVGETWNGEAWEGWIRWRDEERGTWLWYPTRGC